MLIVETSKNNGSTADSGVDIVIRAGVNDLQEMDDGFQKLKNAFASFTDCYHEARYRLPQALAG